MSSKHKALLFHFETACLILAAAIGKNPWASAFVVLLMLASRLADKYFHDTMYDENKLLVAKLREDFTKLKAKQDQVDMKAAFGGLK